MPASVGPLNTMPPMSMVAMTVTAKVSKQVRGHAGAVADVVADVVGDHGRVARVVFRNACLDLADEVGADVRAFGEDAAAESREDGDQRCAEREADHRVQEFARRDAHMRGFQQHVEARHAEQPSPTTSRPVMAPPRKAMLSAGFSPSVAACAVRTFARTDTFMPT